MSSFNCNRPKTNPNALECVVDVLDQICYRLKEKKTNPLKINESIGSHFIGHSKARFPLPELTAQVDV